MAPNETLCGLQHPLDQRCPKCRAVADIKDVYPNVTLERARELVRDRSKDTAKDDTHDKFVEAVIKEPTQRALQVMDKNIAEIAEIIGATMPTVNGWIGRGIEEMTRKRVTDVAKAFTQYQEGAITYIEFVRFCVCKVTQLEVAQHNAVCDTNFLADWPFKG